MSIRFFYPLWPRSSSGGGSGVVSLSSFSLTTATLTDDDGVLIYDGSALKRMSKRNAEAQLQTVHNKTIQESGYEYQTTQGAGHVYLTPTLAGIQPKAGFELEIDAVLTPGFLIKIENPDDNSKFTRAVVGSRSNQGNFRLATFNSDLKLIGTGTWSAGDEITLITEGLGPTWLHVGHQVSANDIFRVPNGKAVYDFFIENAASISETETGSLTTKYVTPKSLKASEDSLEEETTFSGFTYRPDGDSDGDLEKNSDSGEWEINTTSATRTSVPQHLKKGSVLEIRKDSSNHVFGTIVYAYPAGTSWHIRFGDDEELTGTLSSGDSVTLEVVGRVVYGLRNKVGVEHLKASGTKSAGKVLKLTSSTAMGWERDLRAKLDIKFVSKSNGNQQVPENWTVYPRRSSGGADSQGEISVTPESSNSKFLLQYSGVAGSLGTNDAGCRGDVKFQVSTDGGTTWNDIADSELQYAFLFKTAQNPPMLHEFLYEPNTTSSLVLRTVWKNGFFSSTDRRWNVEQQLFKVWEIQ